MSDYSELKKLEAAATLGPWVRDYGNHVEVNEHGDEGFEEWQEAGPVQVCGDTVQSRADADFVAAAREAVPALIAENEVLSRKIERIQQLVTTQHESKEAFARRVQSVLEWKGEAQS